MANSSSIGLKVPFGRKDDCLYAPAEVAESGLACGCICPGCGAPLLIREGSKRRHFAHYRAPGSNHCVESAVHQAAIQVLLEAKWIRVPVMTVSATIRTKAGLSHHGTHLMAQERIIRFDTVAAEVPIEVADAMFVRPDAVGYRNDRQMLVEMHFRHEVDQDKRSKLERLGSPVIEVDLSDLDVHAGFDAIRMRVLEETAYKKWLVYPGEAQAKAALLERLQQESDAIDEKHRRAEMAAQRKQQQREQERLDRQRRIAQAHEHYRNLPPAVKEQRLRADLGIGQTWPRYLRLANEHNRAIDGLPHLWQASLFQRFIFRKPSHAYTFNLGEAVLWVHNRFGMQSGSIADGRETIRKFLAYLGGCGFIKRIYNHYGDDLYTVLHNQLQPLGRREDEPAQRQPSRADRRLAAGRALQGSANFRNLQWAAEWPSYEDAMKAATKWISMYRDHYVEIVERLYAFPARLGGPSDFAQMMEERGIPAKDTLSFLIEARLAQ